MALGGVATGSMKASEAEMVQGSMTYSGCILMAVAWIKTRKTVKTFYTHAKEASLNMSVLWIVFQATQLVEWRTGRFVIPGPLASNPLRPQAIKLYFYTNMYVLRYNIT